MNMPWKNSFRLLSFQFVRMNFRSYAVFSKIQLISREQLPLKQQQRHLFKYNASVENVWHSNNNNLQQKQKRQQQRSPYQQYLNYSSKPAASPATEEKLKKGNDKCEETSSTPNPDQQSEKRNLPRLMNFPEIMWPSMINTIRNWFLVQFIIRPYLDRDFYLKDFVRGAKKAMQVVSNKLMNGDFKSLNNLITVDALNELKPVVEKLSLSQRRQLEIKDSDIYLSFPYQVGIMFDENRENKLQKRFVEITMVFHVLRGLKELRESYEEIPWNIGTVPEYQDKMFVCNYRFVKEYTIGQESDWIISVVNHFKPIDLINEKNDQ